MLVRPIGPDDKGRLLDAFERSSPESRYRRFFSPIPRLSAAQLSYLTEIDHHGHEALQAVDPQTEQGLGVARFVRSPDDPTVAEVAVAVVDEWQGRGLASALLHDLAARAREEGIARFSASVLAGNDPIMKLFRKFGDVHVTSRDQGVVELLMDLPEEGIPETLAHTVRAVAQGDIEHHEKWHVHAMPRSGIGGDHRGSMPGATTAMRAKQRKADGLDIRYAESDGAGEETVLLLSPWPESLFAWETIWPRLAATARLVAIDLPGFGKSEGRPELFSPHAMGTFLLTLIDEWGLGHPHVVGPDVATGATLFAAAPDLDRFPSAVVGSGAVSVPLEVTGALKELIEAPDTSQFQAVDGREIVAGALEGIERHTLPEAVREDYLSSYAGDRFVESMAYVRNYPTDLPILADRLGDIRTPVQIIAGRHDRLVPPSNAEFLHDRLPESKLDILDTGHFTWEDGAERYLELTRAWVESHPARRT